MLFGGRREKAVKRILIVEDEPLVAFDNEHLLTDAGYHVVATTDNERDATRILQAEAIDLVMLDVSLNEGGSGIRVAEVAAARGVGVMFVTGNCPCHAQHLALACLAKPYSDRVLKQALEAVDALIRGETVRRAPEQLTIFARNAA